MLWVMSRAASQSFPDYRFEAEWRVWNGGLEGCVRKISPYIMGGRVATLHGWEKHRNGRESFDCIH